MFSGLLGRFLGVNLLGHMVNLCLTFEETFKVEESHETEWLGSLACQKDHSEQGLGGGCGRVWGDL